MGTAPNPDYDDVLSSVAPGTPLSAKDIPGKGASNLFRYGVAMGYLRVAGQVPAVRDGRLTGKTVALYLRTDAPVAHASRARRCSWCATAFERYQLPGGQHEAWSRFHKRSHCSRDCEVAERVSTSRGTRTIVARTCIECGSLKDGAYFKRTPTSTDSTCTACRSRQFFKRSTFEERQSRNRQAVRNRVGRRTYTGAARNGYEWTGPEIELLTRDELSSQQIADMIQRTPHAVAERRRLVRAGDPRTMILLNGSVSA